MFLNNKNEDIPFINELTVAVIMDPFTFNSFSSEFNPIILEPENWIKEFETNDIDLLFVESAWHGISHKSIVNGVAIEKIDNPWANKIHTNLDDDYENRGDLFDIISYCNTNNIPTVFWNKEDPTSFYDRQYNFVDTALYFDYIFTTDEDIIPEYESMGHDNVYSLLFASQIKLFNPIEKFHRTNDIVFAGSWYNQFKERKEKMEFIFDKILVNSLNLKIYNRESGSSDPNRQYPLKYQKYIHPRVDLDKMPEVYKESKYSLNINTVTQSNTMFARRVYELMSSNTFVFSNYSKGLDALFKDRIIFLDNNQDLIINEDKIDKIREYNLYDVLENHTYNQRFKRILDIVGLKYKEHQKNVNIIYFINNEVSFNDILKDYYSINYRYKKCIIINNRGDFDDNIKIDRRDLRIIPLNHLTYLNKIMGNNDYFLFRDLNIKLDENFIYKSILHFQYLDKNIGITSENTCKSLKKYHISQYNEYNNILFHYNNLEKILQNIVKFKKHMIDIFKI